MLSMRRIGYDFYCLPNLLCQSLMEKRKQRILVGIPNLAQKLGCIPIDGVCTVVCSQALQYVDEEKTKNPGGYPCL